ncbi:hypothetical protein L7F22_016393 [Adiantum nelumboides]|nr:hypothetical protein [Adiantum nelumboides]
MLPPFKGSKEGFSQEQVHWNYIQSSSRMLVEIMKSRFRILLKRCDMLLSNVPKMVATCMVLHNMCIIHGDAFDEAWVRDTQLVLETSQQEASAVWDRDMQNSTQNGLHEITATTLNDVAHMVCRAQRDDPLEGTFVNEGRSRRDNIAKVMFKEHHNRDLHVTFGLDSVVETYGSSSSDDDV